MSRLFTAAALLAMAAPALADEAKPAHYTAAQVEQAAKAMAKRMGMPLEERIELVDRLAEKLRKPAFKEWTRGRPINGVFAYTMKEGGLVVKWTKGRGKAVFAGGPEDIHVVLKATSIGAQIGGSKQWGVGLIVGLKRLRAFGGDYKGNVRQATAISAGHAITELRRVGLRDEKDHHRVLLFALTKGLSASAGGTKLRISVDWP